MLLIRPRTVVLAVALGTAALFGMTGDTGAEPAPKIDWRNFIDNQGGDGDNADWEVGG